MTPLNILIYVFLFLIHKIKFLNTNSLLWLELDFCDFCCCYCEFFCPVSSCFQMWTYQFQLLHYYSGTYKIYGQGVCTEPQDALRPQQAKCQGIFVMLAWNVANKLYFYLSLGLRRRECWRFCELWDQALTICLLLEFCLRKWGMEASCESSWFDCSEVKEFGRENK